jgi:hypothetical protein
MLKKFLVLLLLLSACTPAGPAATPPVVSVYASAATQAWLVELYECAAQQSVVLRLADSAADAEIVLRLGEPANLSTPAFQVDTEELLVVVNRVHPFNILSAEQVRGLFTGQIDDWSQIEASKTGKVQVWVFAQGEDVQEVFASTLGGSPVVSSARLAVSPEAMSQGVANDENAIGILPRHWKMGNVADVHVAASLPVLALTPSEPQGALTSLLACLQG